ncbi:iron chaperone [Microbacterium phosphatis]|uniref:iron chaperone n=1 Tax=Microbacterium phosphatis TaxID=3140248 RepID=UPI00314016FF
MGPVTDSLAALDEPVRSVFASIHARLRELVPDGITEGMSYGMPALLYRGKGILATVQAKTHLSVFPFSSAVVEQVAPDLAGFSLSKGTIRFSLDQPIPPAVLDRLIELRRAEIDAKRA